MRNVLICFLVLINFQVFGQEIVRLDNAIQLLGRQIENDIRQGSSIAIVSFDSPSDRFSNYVIGELNSYFLGRNRFTVVEQQRIDLVRQQEQSQLSLYVSDETAVRIGYNIGAQYIISGYLIDLGNTYRFGIYAINMQDAVRVAQSSVNLSAYDEQISFLLTGSTSRPSERIISTNLSLASSKAGFMQSISILIGNQMINSIPRNSTIAIDIPGDFVLADYIRNELYFILKNSNRFNIVELSEVDSARKRIYGGPTIYESEVIGENIAYTQTLVNSYLTEIEDFAELLGANAILQVRYMDTVFTDNTEAQFFITIRALHANSLQVITESRALWSWPDGVEHFE